MDETLSQTLCVCFISHSHSPWSGVLFFLNWRDFQTDTSVSIRTHSLCVRIGETNMENNFELTITMK